MLRLMPKVSSKKAKLTDVASSNSPTPAMDARSSPGMIEKVACELANAVIGSMARTSKQANNLMNVRMC